MIVADLDPVWGLEMQEELTLPHLSNAGVTTIESGHSVPMEAPEELVELITPFAAS